MPSRAALAAELVGDLNHDLRTPLNGVIGLAVALSATDLNPQQRQMVDLIVASGHTLDRVLTELLDGVRERAAALDAPPPVRRIPGRPRVLVVDDMVVNRAAVSLMLEAIDADVTEAEDGEDAVTQYAADDFDLVLMDVEMPRLDGLSAVRAIRYLEREEGRVRTPVFMLTANTGPRHERESLAAGADLHIAKPVTEPRLLGVVRAALGLPPIAAVR